MNVLVNLSNINCLKDFERYQMYVQDQTILKRIYSQATAGPSTKIFLLVKKEISDKFVEYAETADDNLIIKIIETQEEIAFANNLLLDDIVLAFKTVKTVNLSLMLGQEFDASSPSVVIDGRKLYKKNVFNFSECTNTTYIKFIDGTGINSNIMLYLHNDNTPSLDVNKIEVKDYINNYIDMTKLDTIIKSSSVFEESKQLRYEYLTELLRNLKFNTAFKQIKEFSSKNIYWAFLYLEFLIGFGCEQELLEYYALNRRYLTEYNFTNSQRLIYKSIFQTFHFIDRDIALINKDIKQYLDDENTEFNFILKSVNNSKDRILSFSYLLKNLIELQKLNENKAIQILSELNGLDINPFIKQKYIIDIADYFLGDELNTSISYEFISQLIIALLKNEQLFTEELSKKIMLYTQNLEICEKTPLTFPLTTEHNFNNKVAVCIFGNAKYNYSKNLELIKNFTKDYLDVDYFVQLWDQIESYPGLSEYGKTPDFEWSKNYLNRLSSIQPTIIKRQANFEALFPQTSKKLFTKIYEESKSEEIFDIFGSNLKRIKKYNRQSFLEKIRFSDDKYLPLYSKLTSYFERYTTMKMIEDYSLESGVNYDYIINIDIDTVLNSPIYLEELKKIKDNVVYTNCDDENTLNFNYTVSKYNEALKMNNLWLHCQIAKSPSPYNLNKKITMGEQKNPMLYHLLYQNMEIKFTGNSFGGPTKNKKIVIPAIKDEVGQDLSSYDGNSEMLSKYFDEVIRIFTEEFPNNQNYKNINLVTLNECQIVNDGVEIELSIRGTNLLKVNSKNLYLHGISNLNIDSNSIKPKVVKHVFTVLKHDDDEIIVKRKVAKTEIQTGNAWNYSLLYHDYTVSHFRINFKTHQLTRELDRYGMLYIKRDKDFEIGIASKSMLLNEF